jgi:hypothetical protein
MKKRTFQKNKLAVDFSPPAPPPQALELPRFGRWVILIYPLALLVPSVGFLAGLLYAPQADVWARRFGRICLALALVGWLLEMATGHDGAFNSGVAGPDAFLQPFR